MSSSRSRSVIRQYRYITADDLQAEERLEPGPSTEEVAVNASNVSIEAEAAVVQARNEAEALLGDARQQVEILRQQAYVEGRREGLELGRAEGQAAIEAQMQADLERLTQIVELIAEQRMQILKDAEREAVELVLAIARKIVGDAATHYTEATNEMVSQAIEKLGRGDAFRIQLHPTDASRLEAYWQSQETRPNWQVVSDERVPPGGCIVSNGLTVVDARPDTQMDLIAQAFRDA